MQGTARLTGQTLGAVLVTTLLTMLPLELAPRVGLGMAAVFTLVAGLVSMLRTTDPEGIPEISGMPRFVRCQSKQRPDR
jgi:hypothetical protein